MEGAKLTTASKTEFDDTLLWMEAHMDFGNEIRAKFGDASTVLVIPEKPTLDTKLIYLLRSYQNNLLHLFHGSGLNTCGVSHT